MREDQYIKLKECLHGKTLRGKTMRTDVYSSFKKSKSSLPVKKKRRSLNLYKDYPINAYICPGGHDDYWKSPDNYCFHRLLKLTASPSTSFVGIKMYDFTNNKINGYEWVRVTKFIRKGE